MEKYFNGFYEPLFLEDTFGLEYEQILQKEQEYTDNLTQEEAYKKVYKDLCVLKQTSSHIICRCNFTKALIKALVDLDINATVCLYISAKDGILNYADLEKFYLKVKDINSNIKYAFYLPNVFCEESDFESIINLCKKYNLMLVVKTSTTLFEMGECSKKNSDKSPIEVLEEMGTFNVKTMVVGCNYLEDKDYLILQNENAIVCTLPIEYANYGLGFLNVEVILNHKINYVIGSGCFINQDLFNQLQFLISVNKLELKSATACKNVDKNILFSQNFKRFIS